MRLRALAPLGPVLALLVPGAALAAWTGPATLTPRGDEAAYAGARVAAADGRALAVWVRAPSGTRGRAQVQMAERATPTARWSRARTLSGTGADQPRVALNGRGDAVVAWVSGRRIVAAVRRGAAGRWSRAPVAEGAGGIQETRVAVNRSGRPTALWSERFGEGFEVQVASRASARAGWILREPRLATPGPPPPSISLSRGGALVAWEDDGTVRVTRTRRGVFERPAEQSGAARGPAAVLSGSRIALAAWSVALPGGTSVMMAAGREPEARGWSVSQDVGIGIRPRAALNDRGDAVVAWSLDEPGSPQGVEAATRRGPRGAWRASTVVPRRICECALVPGAVAVDGRGTALVAWHRDGGSATGSGGAAALERGAPSWARARVLPGRLARSPAVAADTVAGGVAVWVEAGGTRSVRAATLRP